MPWWAVPGKTLVLIGDTNWTTQLEGLTMGSPMAPHKGGAQNKGKATEGQKRRQE